MALGEPGTIGIAALQPVAEIVSLEIGFVIVHYLKQVDHFALQMNYFYYP